MKRKKAASAAGACAWLGSYQKKLEWNKMNGCLFKRDKINVLNEFPVEANADGNNFSGLVDVLSHHIAIIEWFHFEELEERICAYNWNSLVCFLLPCYLWNFSAPFTIISFNLKYFWMVCDMPLLKYKKQFQKVPFLLDVNSSKISIILQLAIWISNEWLITICCKAHVLRSVCPFLLHFCGIFNLGQLQCLILSLLKSLNISRILDVNKMTP